MFENSPNSVQNGLSLRVMANQFALDSLETNPRSLEQTPQMLSTNLLEQPFLVDQKVPKFGQGPATIGQAKFNWLSPGPTYNLFLLGWRQARERPTTRQGAQTGQTLLVEGVQVGIDGLG